MWRFFSIISFITTIIFTCRILLKKAWFDRAVEKYGGYYDEESYKGKVTKVKFGIKAEQGDVQIIFKHENILEKLLKLLWICREFQTDDPSFDKHVFIIADDHIVLDYLKSSPEVRQTILELLDDKTAINIRNITLSKECAWVEMSGKSASTLNSEIASKLTKKLKIIQDIFITGVTPVSSCHYKRYQLLQAFNNLLLLGMISYFFLVNKLDSMSHISFTNIQHLTIATTIILVVLYLFLIEILFKRTSYAFFLLRDFVLFGILSFALCSFHFYRSINIDFDKKDPKIQKVNVINKSIHRSRRSTSYYVTISDWKNSYKTYNLSITSQIYYSLPEGGLIDIKVHNGYLNDEWIEYI